MSGLRRRRGIKGWRVFGHLMPGDGSDLLSANASSSDVEVLKTPTAEQVVEFDRAWPSEDDWDSDFFRMEKERLALNGE